jgi:hypothetical protein
MTFGEFFGFIVINAVLFGLLQKLATMWLKARLDESIRHEYNVALANLQNEYDRQMELFRLDQRRRERAAMIAELFAEWIAKPADYKRLNRLSFEATLWLPDNIVIELSKRLTNTADAKDIRELLVDVRRHLMDKPDAVEPGHIIHFEPPPQDRLK